MSAAILGCLLGTVLVAVVSAATENLPIEGYYCTLTEWRKPTKNAEEYLECTDPGASERLRMNIPDGSGLWKVHRCRGAGMSFVQKQQLCLSRGKVRRQQALCTNTPGLDVCGSCTATNLNPAIGSPCDWTTAPLGANPYGSSTYLQCGQNPGSACGSWQSMPCPTGTAFNVQLSICTPVAIQNTCGNSAFPACGCASGGCAAGCNCNSGTCCCQPPAPIPYPVPIPAPILPQPVPLPAPVQCPAPPPVQCPAPPPVQCPAPPPVQCPAPPPVQCPAPRVIQCPPPDPVQCPPPPPIQCPAPPPLRCPPPEPVRCPAPPPVRCPAPPPVQCPAPPPIQCPAPPPCQCPPPAPPCNCPAPVLPQPVPLPAPAPCGCPCDNVAPIAVPYAPAAPLPAPSPTYGIVPPPAVPIGTRPTCWTGSAAIRVCRTSAICPGGYTCQSGGCCPYRRKSMNRKESNKTADAESEE